MSNENKRETAAMADGEIVPVYSYHYTGTVNVWLTPEQEQAAWDELQAVPAYVERYKDGEKQS